MLEVGVAFALVGAALLVAEAHVPGGVLGVLGGTTLALGLALALAGAGAGIALVIAAVIASAAVAGLWLAVATRKALATRNLRISSGSEALSGRIGVVRSWSGSGGQVLVDGALWRARSSWPDEKLELGVGDPVVVERVNGLTLGVRRAEEWEEQW